MADLIERSEAIIALNQLYPGIPFLKMNIPKWKEKYSQYLDCERAIEALPAVDAVPVRHGHWIELGNKNSDGTHNICCSACRDFKIKSRGHAMSYYTKTKYKFCGGCGAKMDEKEDRRE